MTREREQVRARLVYFGFILSLTTNFSFPLFISILLKNDFSETISLFTHTSLLLIAAFLLPIWGYKLDKINSRTLILIPFLLMLIGAIGTIIYSSLLPLFLLLFSLGASITTFLGRRIIESKNLKGSLQNNILNAYLLENVALAFACILAIIFSHFFLFLIILDLITSTIFLLILFKTFYRDIKITQQNFSIKASLQELYKDNSFLGLGILLIITFSHMSSLPLLYSRNLANPIESMALMLIINTFTILITSKFVLKLFSYNSSWPIIFSSLLLSIGFGIASLNFSNLAIIGSSILWSMAETIILPITSFKIINSFPEENQGVAVGIKELVIKGSIVLSSVFTFSIQNLNKYALSGVYILIPVIAFLIYKSERKQPGVSLN